MKEWDFMYFLLPSISSLLIFWLVSLLFLDYLELSCLYSVLPADSHCFLSSVLWLNESSAYCCPFLHGWVLTLTQSLIFLISSSLFQEALCYHSLNSWMLWEWLLISFSWSQTLYESQYWCKAFYCLSFGMWCDLVFLWPSKVVRDWEKLCGFLLCTHADGTLPWMSVLQCISLHSQLYVFPP